MAQLNGTSRSDPERQKFESDLVALTPFLRAYARSLTHSRDLAEDLVQDSFFNALRYRDQFKPGTNMRAWLFTIARNRFLTERRRDRFWGPYDHELAARMLTSDGEISSAEATYDFRRLLLCLTCLPHPQSDALIAVGYLGLDYEDTAERTGVAVGTVKSRVARGREALAALFHATDLIPEVDLTWLKTATRGIPKSHPFYLIASAYEELYAAFRDDSPGESPSSESPGEKLWNELVASGALDNEVESLDELMR